jgi:hypothetical protein
VKVVAWDGLKDKRAFRAFSEMVVVVCMSVSVYQWNPFFILHLTQLSAMWHSGLDPGTEKQHEWKNW